MSMQRQVIHLQRHAGQTGVAQNSRLVRHMARQGRAAAHLPGSCPAPLPPSGWQCTCASREEGRQACSSLQQRHSCCTGLSPLRDCQRAHWQPCPQILLPSWRAHPGATAFTLMPAPPSSQAPSLVSMTTPALEAP